MKKFTKKELNNIRKQPYSELRKLGIRKFDKEGDTVMYLYPESWYDKIPIGYPIVNIFGKASKFTLKNGGNDSRFGCLSFGFKRKEK